MSIRDGKDKFYQTLHLDKETRLLLKWYKEVKRAMMKEIRK